MCNKVKHNPQEPRINDSIHKQQFICQPGSPSQILSSKDHTPKEQRHLKKAN